MPTISRFFGIIISMHYQEHGRPHFHVRHEDSRAAIAIDDLKILAGSLRPRAYGLVVEWALKHRPELNQNWVRAQKHEQLQAIEPLQ